MNGCSLAELLTVLWILGIIGKYTIPKIITSSQDQRDNAIAKETAGMIAGEYQTYNLRPGATTNTEITHFRIT